ncbi:ABC transporter [Pseudalkalibacillus sp. Hm43]|uniref:ABC transporter n=1 Tax=Pseudalkalibacillus sp. Hm43 TaxID=3450742 RepID=UPI003F42F009
MVKTYEFFVFFNRVVWKESKLAIVWPMMLPLITFFLINYRWFYDKPDFDTMISYFAGFWAFIIVTIFLNGVGLRLSIFRETGFLKSFTYMAGSKNPIVFGLLMNQMGLGFISLIIFTFVNGLIFQLPVFTLLYLAISIYILVALPIFLLMMWLPSISVRSMTIYSISNMLIFPATFIAVYRDVINFPLLNFVFSLNPVEYVYRMSILLSNTFQLTDIATYNNWIIVAISILYMTIGILCWRKLKLVSTIVRT